MQIDSRLAKNIHSKYRHAHTSETEIYPQSNAHVAPSLINIFKSLFSTSFLELQKKISTFQYDLEQIRYQLPSTRIPIFRVPHKSHPTQLWNSVQCLFKNHYICHVDVSEKTIKSLFSNGHGVHIHSAEVPSPQHKRGCCFRQLRI